MKSILFIFPLLLSGFLSLSAFAEETNYNEFEAELSRLESNQVVGAPDLFVDEIVTNQAALNKKDENNLENDEVSKIIPLPGFEDPSENLLAPQKEVSPPKRKRAF